MVKNPPVNTGDARDAGLIPASGDAREEEGATHSVFLPGESMDRGAWWATVCGVAKSQTQLSG